MLPVKKNLVFLIFCLTFPLESLLALGTLSPGLLLSFVNNPDPKDIIIELPSVLESVVQNIFPGGNEDRGDKLVSTLREKTEAAQKPVIEKLSLLGVKEDQITSFWIANKVAVTNVSLGPLQTLISTLPNGLFIIRAPYQASIITVEPETNRSRRQAGNVVQWGVAKINAPVAWKNGIRGEGVILGLIDTGVNAQHEALRTNYKGDDETSWLDAFGVHTSPFDGNGHGTHTAGSAVGTTNGVGVAPGAKWIACRGLDDQGRGNERTLTTCGQFMACPSQSSSSSSCSVGRPAVVSNSWGGALPGQTWYNSVVSTWRELDMVPVFAIGNNGPLCVSASSPGDQPNLIAVGSTDSNDAISSFSSRGPPLSISVQYKPDLVAPGRSIVSADYKSPTGYTTMSGTSMATPHVAGAVALLLSSNSSYKYKELTSMLSSSAAKPRLTIFDSALVCSITPTRYPNNGYGAGRLNVAAALKVS